MPPNSEDIVARMAQAQDDNRTHSRPYIVTRDYTLFDGNSDSGFKSRVVAEITALTPDSKKYTIEDTYGYPWPN